MKKAKTVLKWIRYIILIPCVIYLSIMIIGTPLYFFVESTNTFIELIKTIFQILLWLVIPVFLLVIILRSSSLTLMAALLLILVAVVYLPYLIPRSSEPEKDESTLTIMTFNLKTNIGGIKDIIETANADIVGLQELTQSAADVLTELEDLYPYQALHPQADSPKGQGILSRYPITNEDYWEYSTVPETLGHQRVEIDFDGISIVIYNTHPWPPLGWETGYNDESHRIVVRDIAKRAFAELEPVILVGDFNMSDGFGEYDLLASQFTDSFRSAGDGLGYTFPNNKYQPLSRIIRLDYIWHSEEFKTYKSTVWKEHGESDHSPVLSTLGWQ